MICEVLSKKAQKLYFWITLLLNIWNNLFTLHLRLLFVVNFNSMINDNISYSMAFDIMA